MFVRHARHCLDSMNGFDALFVDGIAHYDALRKATVVGLIEASARFDVNAVMVRVHYMKTAKPRVELVRDGLVIARLKQRAGGNDMLDMDHFS